MEEGGVPESLKKNSGGGKKKKGSMEDCGSVAEENCFTASKREYSQPGGGEGTATKANVEALGQS